VPGGGFVVPERPGLDFDPRDEPSAVRDGPHPRDDGDRYRRDRICKLYGWPRTFVGEV